VGGEHGNGTKEGEEKEGDGSNVISTGIGFSQ